MIEALIVLYLFGGIITWMNLFCNAPAFLDSLDHIFILFCAIFWPVVLIGTIALDIKERTKR